MAERIYKERAFGLGRGVSHDHMRAYNESLVLSLLRRHRALSKAELAKHAQLSPQTVSVIVHELEGRSLILRGEPLRGRIGQPSIPLSLDPEGAFFLGAKIGRRSAEMVLLDFTGALRSREEIRYAWPDRSATVEWIKMAVARARDVLGARSHRLHDLGIALPFRLWEWSEEAGAPDGAMDGWRSLDLSATLFELGLEIEVINDASAACAAELSFGEATSLDMIYFFVGTFIGGGLVQGGRLVTGASGNAGALGSMLVPDGRGRSVQLIDQASLIILERALEAEGIEAERLWKEPAIWSERTDLVQRWLDRAGRGIANALVSAVAVTGSRVVVIDGAFPRGIHDLLIDKIRRHLDMIDVAGIDLPEIRRGSQGPVARALGAAATMLNRRFLAELEEEPPVQY